MMSNSSQSKALAAAEALAKWVKGREAAGDTQSYMRAGKLNKSVVSSELGFARSAWQSNPRLAEMATRLDQKWSTAKKVSATHAGQLMQSYIDLHKIQNNLLPNQSGALILSQIIDEAGVSRTDFIKDTSVRELLCAYADANGLNVSLPGVVAPEEENRDRSSQDLSEMVPVKQFREAQTRLAQLEKKVAELRASNAALRAEKLRSKEIEHLIVAGGRITPDAIK